MPLPDSFKQHLADAEFRLANVKEEFGNGRMSAAQLELECVLIQLDLRAASTILAGSIREDDLRDRIHVDLGPG